MPHAAPVAILVELRPLDDTATPLYEASCTIDATYSARSRYPAAAPYALARALADAGLPDAPLLVRQPGLKEQRYASFYQMAGYTLAAAAG